MHLWKTHEGLNLLRDSLSGTELQPNFDRLRNEVEELNYQSMEAMAINRVAPSLFQSNG